MWRELTEDDVLAGLNAPETRAYKSAATAPGQNVLEQILAQVTQECRGHIADCAKNTLAPGNTLPERVHYHAVALIRFRMMTRLGLEVSEDRRKEQRDALRFFERVAACDVALEPGDGSGTDDGTDSQAAPSPGIKARPRQFSRRHQDGI
jgi:phage gp36-like protein